MSNVFPTKRGDTDLRCPTGEWLEAIEGRIEALAAGVEPRVETAFLDGAEHVVVAYGTPARFVRYAVGQLRDEGLPVGFVRPITLWPFPSEVVARAPEAAAGRRRCTSSTRAR